MRLFKYKMLVAFWKKHPEAKEALTRWAELVETSDWTSHADLKKTFPAADYVGNDRYVFNIGGNKFRTVAVVVFFSGDMHLRFVGTHAEYDRIKDIKSI
ncbi:MAG: type II toxin-antitoxin system HigB family toxin [Bacteroidaceae bacterium]|nr:type II toxin-antitoxin system HigB family toxin [Bacteroidaceae bacterium]